MITLRLLGEKKLYRSLVRIEKNVDKTSGKFVTEAAEWLKNDIRSNWSLSSPSARGSAPAIKTGNLDSSVVVDAGRDLLGRFATMENTKLRIVRIDTSKGKNPMGRGNYSQALEDEEYLDRPFMQPAVDRLEAAFPSLAKRNIKL